MNLSVSSSQHDTAFAAIPILGIVPEVGPWFVALSWGQRPLEASDSSDRNSSMRLVKRHQCS